MPTPLERKPVDRKGISSRLRYDPARVADSAAEKANRAGRGEGHTVLPRTRTHGTATFGKMLIASGDPVPVLKS
jgi:hypothetical protein